MLYCDISINKPFPANVLSNLAPNAFTFRPTSIDTMVECASMEGLLQAFKFKDPAKQLEIVKLTGLDAKYAGRAGDGWKKNQYLYWQGAQFDRHGKQYQTLLDIAYQALFTNPDFRRGLAAARRLTITHNVGTDDPNYTILTKDEFVSRIVKLRNIIIEYGVTE